MGGGPRMRCTALDLLNRGYRLMGLSGVQACSERRWYALRNFHMQYYEDSHLLNDYLHFWRDSMEDYWQHIASVLPRPMKALRVLCRAIPGFRRVVESKTYEQNRRMAEEHRNGTLYWYRQRNDARISAFFKDYATYESIPDWGIDMPQLDPEPAWHRLDHGYDEAKSQLELGDLRGAARFRGGECLSERWDGDLYTALQWKCARGHVFDGRPYTILKAGHWCPQCLPPPWDYDQEARINPFFAQVWYPNHDPQESNFYSEECCQDIVCADEEWSRQGARATR